jgi:SAM-dependent methyltransferase
MPWRKVVYRKLVAAKHRFWGIPSTGHVSFGDLRRVEPLGRHFGTDRGQAVDRHYIEQFLKSHADDVRGHVLEVGDDGYTRAYGGEQVTRSDVLHVNASNPQATIVADLADAPHIPSAAFDCIILTQVLHLIYEPGRAVRTLGRILKPGGVLLLTTPGITQVPQGTTWADTWYWAFTELSTRRMLEDVFGTGRVTVESHGNVFAATAMLYGLAVQDLGRGDLEVHDPDYPVIIAARAHKRPASG